LTIRCENSLLKPHSADSYSRWRTPINQCLFYWFLPWRLLPSPPLFKKCPPQQQYRRLIRKNTLELHLISDHVPKITLRIMLDSLNSKTIEFRLCRYISIPKLSFLALLAWLANEWRLRQLYFSKDFFRGCQSCLTFLSYHQKQ